MFSGITWLAALIQNVWTEYVCVKAKNFAYWYKVPCLGLEIGPCENSVILCSWFCASKIYIISVQRGATLSSLYFILLHDHSTCFGCLSHPSSGVHETVVTTTGTSHMVVQLPRSSVAKLDWGTCPINEYFLTDFYLLRFPTHRDIWLVVTFSCSPDDGCERHPKHVEWFYVYGSVHHNIFYEITNRCSYMQSILFHC